LGRIDRATSRPVRQKAAEGTMKMPDFDFRYLMLIPFTLAEAFLFWAIWQLQKQMRKPGKH
jgi:hypothetical protein